MKKETLYFLDELLDYVIEYILSSIFVYLLGLILALFFSLVFPLTVKNIFTYPFIGVGIFTVIYLFSVITGRHKL